MKNNDLYRLLFMESLVGTLAVGLVSSPVSPNIKTNSEYKSLSLCSYIPTDHDSLNIVTPVVYFDNETKESSSINMYTWFVITPEYVEPFIPKGSKIIDSYLYKRDNMYVEYIAFFTTVPLSEEVIKNNSYNDFGNQSYQYYYMKSKNEDETDTSSTYYICEDYTNGDELVSPVFDLNYAPIHLIYDIDYAEYKAVSQSTINYLNKVYVGHYKYIGLATKYNVEKYNASIYLRDIKSEVTAAAADYYVKTTKELEKGFSLSQSK